MTPAPSSATLAVTGFGLISSLGLDGPASCSAARAGVTRAMELDYYQFKSPVNGEMEPAFGHAARGLTDGFEGFPRLLSLARPGLLDLLRDIAPREPDPARTGLYLSLPDPARVASGLELVLVEETKEYRASLFPAKRAEPARDDGVLRFVRALTAIVALPIPEARWSLVFSGHGGGVTAIRSAARDLRTGAVDFAIVGGVESLLDYKALQWLADCNRLKNSGLATGVRPGEAAGFLLLERADSAASAGARIRATVLQAVEGEEEAPLLAGKPPLGVGLAGVLRQVFEPMAPEKRRSVWILCDQNGESYRAAEWGFALTRLVADLPEIADCPLSYPVVEFGDTSAASAVVTTCVATWAFERECARGERALVLSSSDGGQRAALLLGRGATPGARR